MESSPTYSFGYTSKTKTGECKNEGCTNKRSIKTHSAYCDECIKKNKEKKLQAMLV